MKNLPVSQSFLVMNSYITFIEKIHNLLHQIVELNNDIDSKTHIMNYLEKELTKECKIYFDNAINGSESTKTNLFIKKRTQKK